MLILELDELIAHHFNIIRNDNTLDGLLYKAGEGYVLRLVLQISIRCAKNQSLVI